MAGAHSDTAAGGGSKLCTRQQGTAGSGLCTVPYSADQPLATEAMLRCEWLHLPSGQCSKESHDADSLMSL